MDLFGTTITLRDYQQETVNQTLQALRLKKKPVIVLPTGAGKSIVIAELCRVKNLMEHKKVLIVASRKELIEQNADKVKKLLPQEEVAIYSAGLSQKNIADITLASIQSIYRQKEKIIFDVVIIDEAHEINHKDNGMYRNLIKSLQEQNNKLEVIGLTATPYRLGHGLITDPPAIFDAFVQCAGIKKLQDENYLTKIITKATRKKIDVSGVHLKGGEFVEAELQESIKKFDDDGAVQEIIARGSDRKSWLIFATGVDHAKKINKLLLENKIKSVVVYGEQTAEERDKNIADFRSGKVQAIINANILTTGFDHPGIDLIALLRPTMSMGLFVQMVGRGLRVASEKENCLVLDFAGNFARHGVDFDALPEYNKDNDKNGNGKPLTKICPGCSEIIALQARKCPVCGYEAPKGWMLWDGTEYCEKPKEHEVEVVRSEWYITTSKAGNKMLVFEAYTLDGILKDFYMIFKSGFAQKKAFEKLKNIISDAGDEIHENFTIDDLNANIKPKRLKYCYENGYKIITKYVFDDIPF